jgi:hypothetical protein
MAIPSRGTAEIIAFGPGCVNEMNFPVILSYHLKASLKQPWNATASQPLEIP